MPCYSDSAGRAANGGNTCGHAGSLTDSLPGPAKLLYAPVQHSPVAVDVSVQLVLFLRTHVFHPGPGSKTVNFTVAEVETEKHL